MAAQLPRVAINRLLGTALEVASKGKRYAAFRCVARLVARPSVHQFSGTRDIRNSMIASRTAGATYAMLGILARA